MTKTEIKTTRTMVNHEAPSPLWFTDRDGDFMADMTELCCLFRVSPATISRRVKEAGDFPRPTRIGRRWLWLASNIEAWVKGQ